MDALQGQLLFVNFLNGRDEGWMPVFICGLRFRIIME